MQFLFRMAFWLAVVLALLPSFGSQPAPKVNVSALDAMAAAKATVTDLQSFCARQPDTCAVGSQAAVAIGHRAQAGAKLLYEYLSEQLGPAESGAAVATGRTRSIASGAATAAYLFCGRSGAGLAEPSVAQVSAQEPPDLLARLLEMIRESEALPRINPVS